MMLPQMLRALRPSRLRPGSPARPVAPAAPRPILVGVDGSAAGARALEWATVRALAGRTSLHIVHVVQSQVWLDHYGFMVIWEFEPLEDAQQVLDEAARSARRQAPLLQISTRLRDRETATALLDEGRTAELIVLGQRRWRRSPSWFRQSATSRVARGARGRVVIVGPDNEILI